MKIKKSKFLKMLCLTGSLGVLVTTPIIFTSCSNSNKTQETFVASNEELLSNISFDQAKKIFGEQNIDVTGATAIILDFDPSYVRDNDRLVLPNKIDNKLVSYSETYKNNFNTYFGIVVPKPTPGQATPAYYATQNLITELVIGNQDGLKLISPLLDNGKQGEEFNHKYQGPNYFRKSLKSLIIGGSVSDIYGAAFQFCNFLKKVEISGDVSHIERYAFRECGLLEEVVFKTKNQKVWLDYEVFSKCKNLINVDFGNITSFLIDDNTANIVKGNNGDGTLYPSLDSNVDKDKAFWKSWWIFNALNPEKKINVKCTEMLKTEITKIANVGTNTEALKKLNFI